MTSTAPFTRLSSSLMPNETAICWPTIELLLRIRCGITASILLFVPSPSHGLISLVPWDSTASVADLETVAVNSPRILIDPALHAVRQDGRCGAEPPRDVVQAVGTPRDRADFLVARDGQGRLPELRFLLRELGRDLLQNRRIEARRDFSVVFLDPALGRGDLARRGRDGGQPAQGHGSGHPHRAHRPSL